LIILTLIIASFFNVVLVYIVPICAIYYVLFCRYSCTISIDSHEISVNYTALWNKSITVGIVDIKHIDYQKGYYDFFGKVEKEIIWSHSFPKYCYDRLIIEFRDKRMMTINVNTRMFGFDKILKQAVQLKLMDKL